uniref:Uncharacterized protein n=1 Tax=Globisporangium ultimum (strain ATCC 200006 / CBS 805.95 / DAOM BR144) TaxID=431595 RepID=K3X9F9_GLOUD
MADKQQASASGDLFDGLSLDYNFLSDDATPREFKESVATNGMENSAVGDDPFAFTPRVAQLMDSLADDTGVGDNLVLGVANDHMLFDHDVASNGISGTPRSTASATTSMPTTLNFSFSPATQQEPRYHAAPQHKHKRVRSNPDVIFSFQQTLHSGLDPVNEFSPSSSGNDLRPSIEESGGGRPVPNELANAVISSILNDFQDPPEDGGVLPMAPIGTVQVTTPVGLNANTTSPIPFSQAMGAGQDESFKDMDEFLQDLSWSEIPTDGNTAMDGSMGNAVKRDDQTERKIESSPVAYRSQRIQEGVNELKMKRKRPSHQHTRHHSNPVDLLHNLDQFRILAQQTKQQQQLQQLTQQDPSSVLMNPNPYGPFHTPGIEFQTPQPFNQFQVPPQIASGAARSLHDRRSSLPNAAGLVNNNPMMPPRAAARRQQRSGLSMDLSQMNLGFLSVPEEDFQQQYQHFQQQQAQPQQSVPFQVSTTTNTKMTAAEADEANRKLYKCGRCGQPKVGHVCTMPDQRNNWTQVDLEVTKGLKVMRINCHILPVKSRWVPQHEDNVADTD